MAKPRTMKKIWVGKSTRRHASRRELQTPKQVRRETNQEIMHRSALTHGYVLLRFQPQIKHPDTGTFAGYKDAALMVELPTAENAKLFVEQVEMAIRGLVRDFNQRLTRQKGEHTTP